jgi:hypothetical protein
LTEVYNIIVNDSPLVSQKAFVEKDGQVLVLSDPLRGLNFPGGRFFDADENINESLKREVLKDSGIEIEVYDPFVCWLGSFISNDENAGKKLYIVGFKCKYISGEVRLSEEKATFKWINKNNFRELDNGGPYFKALEKYFI